MSVLDSIKNEPIKTRNKIILGAVEGWGKTSFGCYFPKPLFITTPGENGLNTLMQSGRVPKTPYFPTHSSYDEIYSDVLALLNEPHDYKTIVTDTGNGLAEMVNQYAVDIDCDGKLETFLAYGRGTKFATKHWKRLLDLYDRLTIERDMTVLMLFHVAPSTFQNPMGQDYDRYTGAVDAKHVWPMIKGWGDMVLFGTFDTSFIKGDAKDAKAKAKPRSVGNPDRRILYTERSAAWDAKNRHGLPFCIEMGDTAADSYKRFVAAFPKAQPNEDATNETR